MFAAECRHEDGAGGILHTRWIMKILRGRGLFLFLVLGTACAPMKEIDIQVMVPAEITLPLNVNEIAFLNRSIIPRLMDPDSTHRTDEEYFIMDTIMNNWIFLAIRKSMQESPLFDLDTLSILRSRRYDTTGLLDPLPPSQLQRLKQIHPADAIISLEFYNLVDSSSVKMVSVLDEYGYPGYAIEAYLGLYTVSLWRIYDMTKDSILDVYTIRDSVDWYNTEAIYDDAVEGLPSAVDAIRAAAFNTGAIYGERICPSWVSTQRYYYSSGGKAMRQASKKADLEDWQGAAFIWNEISSGENPRAAAKASFNLALVYEMEDQYLSALDWALKSYAVRQEDLTLGYIRLLKDRYEQQKKLHYQVPAGN